MMDKLGFDLKQVVADTLLEVQDEVLGQIDVYEEHNLETLTQDIIEQMHVKFAEALPKAIYEELLTH